MLAVMEGLLALFLFLFAFELFLAVMVRDVDR